MIFVANKQEDSVLCTQTKKVAAELWAVFLKECSLLEPPLTLNISPSKELWELFITTCMVCILMLQSPETPTMSQQGGIWGPGTELSHLRKTLFTWGIVLTSHPEHQGSSSHCILQGRRAGTCQTSRRRSCSWWTILGLISAHLAVQSIVCPAAVSAVCV